MKRCIKCHRLLSMGEFSTGRGKEVCSTCDSCRALAKVAYKKNQSKILERMKKWRKDNPAYQREWETKNSEHRKEYFKYKWAETKSIPELLEKHRDKMKGWGEKTRKTFLEMYGNRCACCGETIEEFLTIEHKLGQAGKKKEGSRNAYGKAIKDYRPDLYEILCMNCNHSKGTKGYCPHQK